MTIFYVHSLDDEFLGTVEATDKETAEQLASATYSVAHRVLTFRLTYKAKIAA